MDEESPAVEPAQSSFQLTLPRMFWCVFIAGLICGFVRLTCLPLWEIGYYGVSAFAIVMAVVVGAISAWEPFAFRGALAMCAPWIFIGVLLAQSPGLNAYDPATQTFYADNSAPAICGIIGILFAYFGVCMALHIRGYRDLSARLLWTPPIVACVAGNVVMMIQAFRWG